MLRIKQWNMLKQWNLNMIFKNSNPNLIFYQIIDPTKKICLVPHSYVKMDMSFHMTIYFIMFLSMLKMGLIFASQLSIYTCNVIFSFHQKQHKREEKVKEIQFSNNILTVVHACSNKRIKQIFSHKWHYQ